MTETVIGDCRLILGDSRQLLAMLPKVDAVVTDPPYGVSFGGKQTKHTQRSGQGYSLIEDNREIGPEIIRECIGQFGRVVAMVPAQNAFDYPKPAEIGSVYCPSGAGLGKWGFIGTHPILYYGKCPYLAAGKGHRPNSFQSFATAEDNGHPCPKPLPWMTWLVNKASFPGQTILDPFMGSGTTAAACIRTGRKFIGIEIDPTYYEIAVNRVREAAGVGSMFPPDKPEVRRELFTESTV